MWCDTKLDSFIQQIHSYTIKIWLFYDPNSEVKKRGIRLRGEMLTILYYCFYNFTSHIFEQEKSKSRSFYEKSIGVGLRWPLSMMAYKGQKCNAVCSHTWRRRLKVNPLLFSLELADHPSERTGIYFSTQFSRRCCRCGVWWKEDFLFENSPLVRQGRHNHESTNVFFWCF